MQLVPPPGVRPSDDTGNRWHRFGGGGGCLDLPILGTRTLKVSAFGQQGGPEMHERLGGIVVR